MLERYSSRVCAVSLAEAAIVVEARQGADAARDLRLRVDATVHDIVAVDGELAWTALAAWRRFGKGRHPAAVNVGGCFPYAVAHLAGVPLLYRGTTSARPTSPRRQCVGSAA